MVIYTLREVTAESVISSNVTLFAHWTQTEEPTTSTTTTSATTTSTSKATTAVQNKSASSSPAMGDKGIPSAAAGIGAAALAVAAGTYALSKRKNDE